MSYRNSVIALFDERAKAETALKQLQQAKFDMKALSIVGRKAWEAENPFGFYTAGDRIKFWGSTGGFWGATLGLLFESAFFIFPDIGPLLAAGPIVAWMIAALEGAAVGGGISAIGAALYSIGIPRTDIVHYEHALKSGQFLIVFHGTCDQVTRAHTVVSNASQTQLYLAAAPAAETA